MFTTTKEIIYLSLLGHLPTQIRHLRLFAMLFSFASSCAKIIFEMHFFKCISKLKLKPLSRCVHYTCFKRSTVNQMVQLTSCCANLTDIVILFRCVLVFNLCYTLNTRIQLIKPSVLDFSHLLFHTSHDSGTAAPQK